MIAGFVRQPYQRLGPDVGEPQRADGGGGDAAGKHQAGGVAVVGLSFGWVWLGTTGLRRKRLSLVFGVAALVTGLVFG